MRIVIIGAAAAILLGSGIAVSLQAIRGPIQPVELPREPSEAAAAPPVVAAAELTPFEFRQVRTVPIIEPGAGRPNAAAATPAGTPQTEVEPALRANADAGRAAATMDGKAPAALSVPMAVAALPQRQAHEVASPQDSEQEQVSSSDRPTTKPHHTWKHSSALAKQSRGARRKADVATPQQEPTPTPLAYDGRNENHSPFSSLGKLFSGAQ